jgi:ELWxxDGT repeat protein
MATLRFDLYQDTVFPYAPSPSNYLNAFTRKITAADGAAWTGLFDSSAGDKTFNTLNFGGTVRTGTNALVVDWNPAGDGVTISTGLKWNDVKNINLDSFDGASLSLRNFVDVLVALGANTTGQSVSVDGAKRGKIDLGSGADTLFVGVDSNNGSNGGNDFYINTGAGNDTVRIARSTIDYSISAFRETYAERWTNTQVRLGDGNDSIIADGSNDTVWGGADNDTAELRGGTNWFDGEAGFDKAVFRGLKADYLIEAVTGGYKVTDLRTGVDGDDGVTTVLNAEQLVFKDQLVTIGGNQAPDAVNDVYVFHGSVLSIAAPGFLANDTDADGGTIVATQITDGVDHGTLTAFPDGSFTYTPTAGYFGTDSFSYAISDGQGGSDIATVFLTVTNANPDAQDDTYTTRANTALNVAAPGFLGNDTDADGDTVTATQITDGVDFGTLTAFPDGNFIYTPNAGFVGQDSFSYAVSDGFGGTDIATVTINVTNINPDAVDDVYVFHGTVLSIAAPGFLANDTDADGDAVIATQITDGVDHGTLTAFPDGSFTYTPNAGFIGTDSFSYAISDGFGGTDIATVTINVTNTNPDAQDDSYATAFNTTLTIAVPGFLANDTDADGDVVIATQITDGVDHGTLTAFPDGSFTYTPGPGFTGTDSFSYQISDGFGGTDTATVAITVGGSNLPPVAGNDAYTLAEDGMREVDAASGLLANDSDPDGAALTVTGFAYAGTGTLSVYADGGFVYVPAADFNGNDSFTYTVSDGQGGSATGAVTLTVTAVNDAPVANDDVYFGTEDAAFGGDLSLNDSDVDGDTLTYGIVGGTPAGLALAANGGFTYSPPADFNGLVVFTYQVADGNGGTDQADVIIDIAAVQDAPVALNDSASTAFQTAVSIDVLGNDSDADGDALSPITDTNPTNGSLVLNADGTYTYTPNAGFSGQDSFTYRAFDGVGFGNVASVTVTVGAPGNRPPVASDTSFTEAEDFAPFLFSLAGLTNDPDNNAVLWTITNVAGGTVSGYDPATGLGTFTPTANFNGDARIDWTVTDAGGLSDSASIVVTVTPVNDAPDAEDDAYSVQEGRTLTVSAPGLLANDSDVDGTAPTAFQFFQPANGTVSLTQDGSFVYTPNAGFSGVDAFVYAITDGPLTDSATVTITVIEGNPIAGDDSYTVLHDRVATIAAPGLLANDSDPNGDPVTAFQFFQPANGTVSLTQDGSFTYTPNAGFVGQDSFTYVISDGVLTGSGTVTIDVINTAPDAQDDAYSVQEGRALTIGAPGLLANDSDADAGDVVTAFQFFQPTSGTVSLTQDGSFTYTPNAGFAGIDSFTYVVTDGIATDQATVTVVVVEGNPVAGDDFYTVVAGNTLTVAAPGLLANDSDPNGDAVTAFQFFQPANGTVSLTQDGSFTYTPNAGFVGTDAFVYSITDGVLTGSGTVSITVTPGNTAPVASDLALTEAEDYPVTLFSLAALTADAESNVVSYAITNLVGGTLGGFDSVSGLGSFLPTANFNGQARIDWTVTDAGGLSDSASIVITITPVNDGPVANTDFLTGTEDVPLAFSIATQLLANDTHPDGPAAQAGTVFDGIVGLGAGIISVVPVGDTLTVTAAPDFSGATSFTYRVRDADGQTSTAVANVNFLPVEDAPVANDDAFARAAGSTQVLSFAQLFANDTDADNTNTNPADDDILAIVSVTPISGISNVAINADNTLMLTYSGGPARFEYTMTDGTSADTAIVTLNDAPVAVDDIFSVAEDAVYVATQIVNVTGNDTDANGDPLTLTGVSVLGGAPVVAYLNSASQLAFYTTDPGFNGQFTLRYTVSDGLGSDTGDLVVTVTPQNDAPRDPQGNDAALALTTAEDTALVISIAALLADDTNPPDEAQVVQLFDLLDWTGGFVVNNGNGTLTFTPNANFNGNASFYYRAEDEQDALGDYVLVPVTVTAVNDPVAANDDIIAREFQGGGTQTITRAQLLGNDSVPDGDEVVTAASIVSGISNLVLNADQSVTVIYAAGQLPVFTYTLSDGTSTDTATVTLNSGPEVTGTPATLVWSEDERDFVYDIDLIALAGITDPNGDPLQIVDFQSGTNFGVDDPFWDSFAASYNYAYFQPFPEDFSGPTTLTFTVSDGNAATDLTVTINVIVQAVNDAPKDSSQYSPGYVGGNDGTDGGFVTIEGTAITILKSVLFADDYDPEGDAFSVVGFGNNSGIGTVVDNGASYTFTPYSFYQNFVGETPGFYYLLEDANGAQSYHYVFIEFTNTPDPITATDDVVARTPGTSQTIAAATFLANDSDPDPGDTRTIIDVVAVNGLDAVSIDGNGDVVVEYAAGGSGRASFTYTVQDSTGNTDTATVELNRAPVAIGEGPITMSEAPDHVFIPYSTLLANDTDADGDGLTVYLYNWGYTGSNVFVNYDTQGGVGGVRVTLYQDEYTGPAEFQYYVYDGNAYSEFVTVTLDVVAGDDVPVANPDYWYNNGGAYGDTNPASNPMVGLEDQVLEFPVSLLTQGQYIGTTYQSGADENDDGTLAQLTIASIASPFGAVEIVDIGGVDHVRFTPNEDVNSAYAWNQASLDWSRVYITYSVDDGTTVSNTTQAYLLILPVNDVPVANDDSFTVIGDGPYTLDIGQAGGAFDVRANDTSPDDYPFSIYDYSYITNVVAISGGFASFDGTTLTFTPDGSGDPLVFEYMLSDADGDSDTAQVTLNVLQAAPQAFYFSGSVPAHGRELWVYDPASYDPGLGSAFATTVDAAATAPGSDSGTPREITALADSVFWRDEYNQGWHTYNPALGWQQLSSVNTSAFDEALPEAERNLGIRSGDYFWGATQGEGATLTAWDQAGNDETQVYLSGFDRSLLTDAGHDPAYVAMVSTYDPVTDSFNDAEQVHAVLWDPGFNGFANYQLTDGGDTGNDVIEIAGLQVVPNPGDGAQYAKTLYFAGDFTDGNGIFHASALWRITTTYDGFGWDSNEAPEFLDNGSGGATNANPYALLVTKVPYQGNTVERLFWFQNDATSNGQIATRYDDYFAGFGTSTGSDYFGTGFQGLEIRAWQNGVIFSGIAQFALGPNPFVATWTDADGDGFFDLGQLFQASEGTIEQLVVDGAGNAAWVLDTGDYDTLYAYTADLGTWYQVVEKLGEIDEVELAGGHLVYRMGSNAGSFPTLFDHTLTTQSGIEVPTDEPTGGGTGDGFSSSYANLALSGGLAFEADMGGNNFRLFTTDGVNVNSPSGGGVFRTSEGANLNGNWVGTAYAASYALNGLYSINAVGDVTDLYLASTNFASEAEVLGQKVLFGTTSAAANEVLVYDDATGNTDTLLGDHLLGAASTLGGTIIFNALDFTNPANTDSDPTDNVWTLYAYDGTSVTTLLDLPTGAGGGQHVYEWWRHQDFLGTDDRIFWKQANDTTGVEVHTIDLTAADPASTLTIVDINPGTADGAGWGDALFANGRLYFQASPDGTTDSMRLYTTTDGTDAVEVTGADMLDPGYQFPWLPTAIGNEVFFLANTTVNNTWGVFQVNDDGVTADVISPDTFGYIYGLAAIGTDLYFFEQEGGTDQMWRITTGATPQNAQAPVLLTSFTEQGGFMSDIFAADGKIYFSRDEAATGRELWVLDGNDPTGARLVADLNTEVPLAGYAPEQMMAVPDPLEQYLAGTFQPLGSSGTFI